MEAQIHGTAKWFGTNHWHMTSILYLNQAIWGTIIFRHMDYSHHSIGGG